MEDYIQRITPQQQIAKVGKQAQKEFIENEAARTQDLPAGYRFGSVPGRGPVKKG